MVFSLKNHLRSSRLRTLEKSSWIRMSMSTIAPMISYLGIQCTQTLPLPQHPQRQVILPQSLYSHYHILLVLHIRTHKMKSGVWKINIYIPHSIGSSNQNIRLCHDNPGYENIFEKSRLLAFNTICIPLLRLLPNKYYNNFHCLYIF